MGRARETRKLIDANWHAIYKTRKLIAAKLNSFTVWRLQLSWWISYLPQAKIVSGAITLTIFVISTWHFVNIFTDISSYLCSCLTLSHVGQELWPDLQTDHVSKIGLRCPWSDCNQDQDSWTERNRIKKLQSIFKVSRIYNIKFKSYGPWN